jgi:hypothetical protein
MRVAEFLTHNKGIGNRELIIKFTFAESMGVRFLNLGCGEKPTWQYEITMNFSSTTECFRTHCSRFPGCRDTIRQAVDIT